MGTAGIWWGSNKDSLTIDHLICYNGHFPILEARKEDTEECKKAKVKNQFMLVAKCNQVGERQYIYNGENSYFTPGSPENLDQNLPCIH